MNPRSGRLAPLVVLGTTAAFLAGAQAGLGQGSTRPPQQLHQEADGHWTAWHPPATPPAGAQVHVVVPGDTLWDLAGRYYGNPYLWPQLWERNSYVLDAHWIYPGDPLVVDFEVAELEALEATPPPAPEGAPVPGDPASGDDLDLSMSGGAPVPLGSEDDIYCSGFVGNVDEAFGYRIIGSEYQSQLPEAPTQGGVRLGFGAGDTLRIDLATGDIVYIDGGELAGLAPGDVLTSIEPAAIVRHPHRDEVVGRLYLYQGRVRVLSVQEGAAIAEIVQSCRPVVVGAYLKPFEPEPIPLGRRSPMRPVNLPAAHAELADAAAIVQSAHGIVSMGQDHLVFIDRGADEGVAPGDTFTIYRTSRKDFPPLVVGEAAVLSVHRSTALARILESRHVVYVGDRLAPK